MARVKAEDKAVLKEALSRFREATDADQHNRKEALDDLKFAWNLDGYQWDDKARAIRKNRPILTENRLPQFIRQIVNGQRQNRPSISVAPANDQSGPGVAEVIEGIIRHIEQWSRADLAYDNSFEAAVTSGIGYFRIKTEYADDDGFDQEICIRPIDNPFSVYDDPHYQLPDGSDRKYCFVTEWVERDEFETKYGFKPAELDTALGDDIALWFDDDKRVRVAEYWRVVTETETIAEPVQPGMPPPEKPRTREVERKTIEPYLLTANKIIKRSEWRGTAGIPIIPVYGEVKNVEGRKYRKSLIRDAKESQRINNYFLSAEVESVALQPKAPFLGPVGAFDTDLEKWQSANTENHAFLQYDGEISPARQPPPMFPDALRETRMASIEAMKACMGIYDASLGARSNEVSGVAIEQRAQQGDMSTFHYLDNMARAIRYAGAVTIDLLPYTYDAPRIVRILQPDGQPAMVAINQLFINPQTMQQQQFDLTTGRYDVVVKSGPNFSTNRQEFVDAMAKLGKAYPPLFGVAGDLIFKNMDFPDAAKVAERLAPKPQNGQQQPPPEVMAAQIKAQADQQIAQAKGQADAQAQQARTQADMAIQQHKVQTDAQLETMKTEMSLRLEDVKHQREQDSALQIAHIQAAATVEAARVKAMAGPGENMVAANAEAAGMPNAADDPELMQFQATRAQQTAQVQAQEKQAQEQAAAQRDQTHQQLVQHIGTLVQSLNRPKTVLRGPDGRVTGVQ